MTFILMSSEKYVPLKRHSDWEDEIKIEQSFWKFELIIF